MGIALQPMLRRTEEQAQRNTRLWYSKELEWCGQTIDDDLCILLPIQPTELSNEYMAIGAAIKNLFYFFQKIEQSNADYHKDFMAMCVCWFVLRSGKAVSNTKAYQSLLVGAELIKI